MERVVRVAGMILLAAYPLGVWLAISAGRSRLAGLIVAGLLPILFVRARRGHEQSPAFLALGAGLACLVVLALLLDEGRFLMAVPVVINAGLLVVFGATLASGHVPMVERFARLFHSDDLSAERMLHCRSVTKVWCAFFLVNALVSLSLALFGSLRAWGLYTGGVAYVAMGALFAGEYAVRRIRFG